MSNICKKFAEWAYKLAGMAAALLGSLALIIGSASAESADVDLMKRVLLEGYSNAYPRSLVQGVTVSGPHEMMIGIIDLSEWPEAFQDYGLAIALKSDGVWRKTTSLSHKPSFDGVAPRIETDSSDYFDVVYESGERYRRYHFQLDVMDKFILTAYEYRQSEEPAYQFFAIASDDRLDITEALAGQPEQRASIIWDY